MARPKFVAVRSTQLKVSISDTESTEIVLKKLVAVGNIPLTMADFQDVIELNFNPGGENEEIITATDFSVADDGSVTLGGTITRARSGKAPYDAGGVAFPHSAGTVVVVGNPPEMYNRILAYAEGMANAGAADASDTGKGLVQNATVTQINAGTELGSSGALLSINPADLLNSNYGTRLPTAAEKLKLAELVNTSFFGGNGSDGPLNVTSGTYTIDLSVKTVWQFSSVSISLGATLTFSNGTAGDKVPVIKCLGNFTNAGTITTVGLATTGNTGGAVSNITSGAATAGSGQNGVDTAVRFPDLTLPTSGRLGTGGTRSGGGIGTGGTGGAIAPKNSTYFAPYALNGSGGGSGGGGVAANVGTPGAGGAGGKGSLGLIIEIVGNFTNSGTINLNGEAGTAGANSVGNNVNSWNSGAGGGGGGGAAGSLVLQYMGTYTNSGSITANGGAGGNGGISTNTSVSGGSPTEGPGGGGGSGGANSFNPSVAGGNGGNGSAGFGGGNGGAGAAGIIFVAKVV